MKNILQKIKNQNIFILSVVLIVILNYLGLFEALNQRIYDNYILFKQKKTYNTEIVIVGIDNESIKELGDWPWQRSIYTKALKKIINANPSVIAMSLTFSDKRNEADDLAFYETLKSFPNIVITARFKKKEHKGKVYLVPAENIFSELIYSHDFIKLSDQGVIRKFPLIKVFPAYSLQVLNLYYKDKPDQKAKLKPELQNWLNAVNNNIENIPSEDILIDFTRTPNQYTHINFKDVLNNEVKTDLFKNKIVLLGLTDIARTKAYATPFTGVNAPSSAAVELQAQIIDSLMNYRGLKQIPDWFVYLFSIFLAIGFFYYTKNKRVLHQGLSFVLLLILFALSDYVLFNNMALWFPPALTLFLLISTFGFSIYFTSSKLDNHLILTINKFMKEKDLPVVEVPTQLDSKVQTLSKLLEIINSDRHAIKGIIDGVNSGILVIDNTGKITWANETIKEHFNYKGILETNIKELFEDLNPEEIVRAIEENKFFKKELSLEDFDFLCIINPITPDSKMYVAIFNDITELKELDRLKTDMVRMVSHELKNPLMAIQIFSDNIEDFSDEAPPEITLFNKRIYEAAVLMLDTINDFLNLNKLESNLVDLSFEEYPLNELIKKCLNLQEAIASDKNVKIEFEKGDLHQVPMDSKQITIVINNLVSNAIKYSHKDGKITVTSEPENGFAKVSVRDYGIGMAAEEVDKVFDKFYRCRNNKKNNIKGTGLGLSITKKIVEVHGGEIFVESIEGEGTCFTFKIPVQRQN